MLKCRALKVAKVFNVVDDANIGPPTETDESSTIKVVPAGLPFGNQFARIADSDTSLKGCGSGGFASVDIEPSEVQAVAILL